MTTVNTFEDLIRAMDGNDEWVQAMRDRLLTRELLDMPDTLARFVETTNRRLDEHDRRFDELTRILAEFVETTNRRLDEHDRRFDDHDRRFDELTRILAEFVETTNRRLDDHDRNMQRMDARLGSLLGYHARLVALGEYALIAMDMGLAPVRLVPSEEVADMALDLRSATKITRDEYRSFRAADMVAEVEDEGGQSMYLAVEVSFTVNGRDTHRALRNARFLTEATGKPAMPAVAGRLIDRRVQDLIDSGEVYWHELPEEMFEAE